MAEMLKQLTCGGCGRMVFLEDVTEWTGQELLDALAYERGKVRFHLALRWHSKDWTVWATEGRGRQSGRRYVHTISGNVHRRGREDEKVWKFDFVNLVNEEVKEDE